MTSPLHALPYYGGKSPGGKHRLGPWIAAHLPRRKYYAEPFAGMAGVLLARTPSPNEALNDADERIVNWWRMVRDKPAEFGRLVELTPCSRVENAAQWARLSDPDPLRRALAVHVCLAYGIMHGLGSPPAFSPLSSARRRLSAADIRRLAVRLGKVNLDCTDACGFVAKYIERADSVLYCDPPYLDADTSHYGADTLDRGRLADLFRAARGFVAVSGYGDEWEALGWYRVERRVTSAVSGGDGGDGANVRTEVLWTNEPPAQRELFG